MSGPLLRRALGRHVALTVTIAVLVSGLAALGIWRFAENDARRATEKVGRQIAAAVIVPLSQRDYGSPSGYTRAGIAADLAPFLSSEMVERVKVFAVEGETARVVFSDNPLIEGRVGRLRPDLTARLEAGEVVVQPVPDDAEHVSELALPGRSLEVYVGFRDAAGNPAQLELYVPVSVAETVGHAVGVLVPLVLIGLLVVALATVPLSLSLARRMERDRAERHALRRYGLAAADLARRDLAQRLHEGVVPDLAGTSHLLEAIHARGISGGGDAPWELIGRAQGVVAHDVRQLRALLDELVPPEVVAADLAGALGRLAERVARETGDGAPEVVIDVVVPDGMPDATAAVLHNVAGELLRNAFRHAGAARVDVRIAAAADGATELTVADDGVGFDPDRARRAGHVGLSLVRRIVGDVGGDVVIDARSGAGSIIRVRVS